MTQYSKNFLDKLSLSRPGSRLIEIVPCAIPAFVVKAEVLVIERRPVGPVEEFILKAIDHGFVVPPEISGLLGLEEALVIETLAGLQREEYVHQVMALAFFVTNLVFLTLVSFSTDSASFTFLVAIFIP